MKLPKKIWGWNIGYLLALALAIGLFPTRFMLFTWPLLLCLVLFYLCRNKLWLATAKVVVVCAIPFFGFFHGVRSYFNNTGKLVYHGDPIVRVIHPELRCEIRFAHDSTGIFTLIFLPHTLPYNFALGASIRLFGMMPGSYLGPYPDREEAIRVLEERGKPVVAAPGSFGLYIGSKEYYVDEPNTQSSRGYLVNNPGAVIGAVIDDQCILIGRFRGEDGYSYWIDLYDASTGEQIGHYWK